MIPVTNLQAVDVLKTESNLETAKVTQIIDLSEAQQVRILCVLITLDAVVSYRSVPRILQLFNLRTPLKLDWIPPAPTHEIKKTLKSNPLHRI